MLLSILLQAAAGAGLGKLGAALGAAIAVIGAGIGIGKIGGSAMEAGVTVLDGSSIRYCLLFVGKIRIPCYHQNG